MSAIILTLAGGGRVEADGLAVGRLWSDGRVRVHVFHGMVPVALLELRAEEAHQLACDLTAQALALQADDLVALGATSAGLVVEPPEVAVDESPQPAGGGDGCGPGYPAVDEAPRADAPGGVGH
jgi:hypothetical protein